MLQESCVLTLDCFALFLDKLYVFGILALVSEGCAIYFPAKQYMRIHVILVVVVRSNHFLGVSCTLMSVSLGMSAYANPVGNHLFINQKRSIFALTLSFSRLEHVFFVPKAGVTSVTPLARNWQ